MIKNKSDKTAEAGQATEADRIAVERLLDAHSQEGLENMSSIAERAFWHGEKDLAWYETLEAIDKRCDKQPLLRLLRSKFPMSQTVREHLANLLERHDLKAVKRGKGRPRTASYDLTPVRAVRLLVMEEIKERIARIKAKEVAEGKRVKDIQSKAIEDTILKLAAINPDVKGLKRELALVKAAAEHGITFEALKQDFNRGPRPKPKKKEAASR